MKWKYPKVGDTRVVKRFAWTPVIVGDSKVWLEFYHAHEEYICMNPIGCFWSTIKNTKTIDKE